MSDQSKTTIVPELRYLAGQDLGAEDLRTFSPEDPRDFGVYIRAFFGPKDGEGEEFVDLVVCTPSYLERKVSVAGVIIGRGYLIVSQYDYSSLEACVAKFLEQCSAETWLEVIYRVWRLGNYEFEYDLI